MQTIAVLMRRLGDTFGGYHGRLEFIFAALIIAGSYALLRSVTEFIAHSVNFVTYIDLALGASMIAVGGASLYSAIKNDKELVRKLLPAVIVILTWIIFLYTIVVANPNSSTQAILATMPIIASLAGLGIIGYSIAEFKANDAKIKSVHEDYQLIKRTALAEEAVMWQHEKE